jgi:hypothetical protein
MVLMLVLPPFLSTVMFVIPALAECSSRTATGGFRVAQNYTTHGIGAPSHFGASVTMQAW